MNALQSISRGAMSSWAAQNRAPRLLRVFLGATFIYAGWNKASDPGFLTQGEPSYIGTQLAAFAANSPIGFLLNRLLEHAIYVGVFVMVAEFAVGIATLLSVAPATAAFGGLLTSVTLWLSSSFYTTPYFLAGDSAYAVMWLAYLLLLIGNRRMPATNFQRRSVLRTGIVGALAVIASIAGRALPKSAASTSVKSSTKASGNQIIKVADLPVGKTFNFVHSTQGVPSILFRTKTGVFAYSAICTHQGCSVAYKSSTKKLICPCHAAQFDPFANAKVVAGPAERPLAKVNVKINGLWVVEA
jgi:thiosulfate dehydrogenase [quinone] large subunit